MPDQILLKNMRFQGNHGVGSPEKELGQTFIVDLSLELDLSWAGGSDDLQDTTDYSLVFNLVRDIVTGESHNLLESLAVTIAQKLLLDYKDSVEAVRVRVTKPNAPIQGALFDGAAVEIYRTQESFRGLTFQLLPRPKR